MVFSLRNIKIKHMAKKIKKKNNEIEKNLLNLIAKRTKLKSLQKQNYVRLFKLETAQLEIGKDCPIYISVENYTLTNKEIGDRSYKDSDRPFTSSFPKCKRLDL